MEGKDASKRQWVKMMVFKLHSQIPLWGRMKAWGLIPTSTAVVLFSSGIQRHPLSSAFI